MAEVRLVEVVDTGPGWNKVRASDGNVYTLRGDYNWRSNNPGNIEYGDFARSQGAIGSGAPPPGRPRGFAIFPTKEAGEQARIALQFESPSYRDKTISQAIARYAPSFENDTNKYVRIVSDAAGVLPSTRMRDLTPAQRRRFLEAQERFEGFRVGTIEAEGGKAVPRNVVAQFNGTPLPPGDVGEDTRVAEVDNEGLTAIGEATGLPFPSLENLNAYFEQPDSVRSLLAPVPAPVGDRPRIAPVPAPYDARPSAPPVARSLLDDTTPQEQSPLDMMLSGQPINVTSRMDDSGQVLTPWFSDYPPTQALRPDIPSGGLAGQDGGQWNTPSPSVPGGEMAGQSRGTWNIPGVEVPGGRMAGQERSPRSLTASGSDPFDAFNALRPDPDLAQSVADYATKQSNLETLLGSSNTSFAGQEGSPARSLLGTAPQPATMSAGLSASRRAPTPQMPSRSLTDSRRSSIPEPATPSASLTRSRNRPDPVSQSPQMAAQRAIPFPAQQSASLLESRQPPQPATQSASLAQSRQPQAPQPAMRQSMLSRLNETKLPELAPPMEQGDGQPYRFDSSYDAPFGAFDDMTQDAATATGLADFIAGQSAQAATTSSFDDMMGVEPRLSPSSPNLPAGTAYPSGAQIEAATGFRGPDSAAIPDPMDVAQGSGLDWYLPPMIDEGVWGSGQTLPQIPQATAVAQTVTAPINPVATELDVVPPPIDPNIPIPAARPAIAPVPAVMNEQELHPLKRLFDAVMETEQDRNNRAPVGTILGTADNGGRVTQGHNGLLNSITQESDYWRRATGQSRGSGSGGGGGARSLVGTR